MSRTIEKPKLAIFDLGNVVFNIHWDPMFEIWCAYSGVPISTLKERVKQDGKAEQFERNEISGKEFHRHVNTMLMIDLSYAEFCDGWNAIFAESNTDICTLLPKLKSIISVVAYTNTNELHATEWAKRYANDLKNFDEIFISSRIGFRKPEPAGFHYVLKQTGFEAREAVFFDDLDANIKGAEQLGIKAVLVDAPAKVGQALREMGFENL